MDYYVLRHANINELMCIFLYKYLKPVVSFSTAKNPNQNIQKSNCEFLYKTIPIIVRFTHLGVYILCAIKVCISFFCALPRINSRDKVHYWMPHYLITFYFCTSLINQINLIQIVFVWLYGIIRHAFSSNKICL